MSHLVGPPNSAGGSDRGTGRSLEVLDVRKKKVNMFRGPPQLRWRVLAQREFM